MNVNPNALTQAHQLAADSGKVEPKRLARAMELVSRVTKTFSGEYTDGSHMDEYWIPGSVNRGYSITVRNKKLIGGCQCNDYRLNKSAYCKHMTAVSLVVRAQELTPVALPSVPMTIGVTDAAYRRQQLDKMFGPD